MGWECPGRWVGVRGSPRAVLPHSHLVTKIYVCATFPGELVNNVLIRPPCCVQLGRQVLPGRPAPCNPDPVPAQPLRPLQRAQPPVAVQPRRPTKLTRGGKNTPPLPFAPCGLLARPRGERYSASLAQAWRISLYETSKSSKFSNIFNYLKKTSTLVGEKHRR